MRANFDTSYFSMQETRREEGKKSSARGGEMMRWEGVKAKNEVKWKTSGEPTARGNSINYSVIFHNNNASIANNNSKLEHTITSWGHFAHSTPHRVSFLTSTSSSFSANFGACLRIVSQTYFIFTSAATTRQKSLRVSFGISNDKLDENRGALIEGEKKVMSTTTRADLHN